jgi:hypothetical protein
VTPLRAVGRVLPVATPRSGLSGKGSDLGAAMQAHRPGFCGAVPGTAL